MGAVRAVRNEGVNVIGVASVFTYGLPDADRNFAAANTTLYPLLSYAELISQGHQENKFSDEEYARLSTWHKAPWDWTKREEQANAAK